MGENSPPLRWLFDSSERRKAVLDYWLLDCLTGGARLAFHEGLRLLPTDICSLVGAEIVKLTRHLYPASDARARRLWRSLHPLASQAEEERALRTLWRNVSRTMTEYSILDRLWAQHRITVVGKEHPDAARAAGRPILFVGLHLGNWEVIGPTLVAIGYPGSGFYDPPVNRFDHRIASKVRLRYGAKIVFPRHSAGRAAFRLLQKAEEVFLIYIDELRRGRVSAPALGRELKAEGNIAHVVRLARLTGAAIIPIYCERIDDRARFQITFLPAVPIVGVGKDDANLLADITALNEAIEPAVRAHIDQWYYALDFEVP